MLLEGIAGLLNRNIASSSRAHALCTTLEGRCLGITVQAPVPITIFVSVQQGALRLEHGTARDADATVTGAPLALLALAGRDAAQRLRNGSVRVEGDGEIVESFHGLLLAARPDLEEEMSRLVGDVAAHQLGNLARAATGWGRSTAATFAANVAEYLQEESRDLVTRIEADEFSAGCDELRERADRMAARLDRIAPRGRQ
jgi:ubiquinone biosynthesis protein UbiJ